LEAATVLVFGHRDHVRWVALAIRLERLARKIKNYPHRLEYTDSALAPLINEAENLVRAIGE
jgi:hypothetical protein